MSNDLQKPDPFEEPTVLDYVKSLLSFGNRERIRIPGEEASRAPEEVRESRSFLAETPALQTLEEVKQDTSFWQEPPAEVQLAPALSQELTPAAFPWRSLLALFLALIAQVNFEPPHDSTTLGIALYIAAFSMLVLAIRRGEWQLPSLAPTVERSDPLTFRHLPLFLAVVLGAWAFLSFGGNLFTRFNLMIWVLATGSLLAAFWLGRNDLRVLAGNVIRYFGRDRWNVTISRWTLLLIAVGAVAFFFRFYQTASVPPEPFSDQAEKLMDVYDISQGQTRIFFPRNTGREGFQMYWTLLIARIFDTGISYFSLKLGTAILGFLTLPFIYLLGKEIGGTRVGLIALLLTGIGYWPNVISRVGLRFPLYPLFAAPVLFFLLRGLRTRNRNDFLLSGLFLGLGLHGYSPMRIVPFVVVVAFFLYWLHGQSRGVRRELPIWLAMLALVSLFVFLPLLRYWFDDPALFGFRAFTRLGTVEQPLPGPPLQIFVSNLWNALRMFNYDDGEIWVHSVTHRPALDIVSAALFLFGVALLIFRYTRHRHWLDLFLLVSVPLLSMPSILSLAFPGENPALNRAGGAYIPAFLISALALDGLMTAMGRRGFRGVLAVALAGLLFLFSAVQNYDLVFNQYYTSFRAGSWNTSDMGRVIQEFRQVHGPESVDNVWVVPFPHWVDTRLPAAWAGIPNRDMALWPENLHETVNVSGPKLFMVKADLDRPEANDQATLDLLESLYPEGQLRLFDSDVPGHDFWIYSVPE